MYADACRGVIFYGIKSILREEKSILREGMRILCYSAKNARKKANQGVPPWDPASRRSLMPDGGLACKNGAVGAWRTPTHLGKRVLSFLIVQARRLDYASPYTRKMPKSNEGSWAFCAYGCPMALEKAVGQRDSKGHLTPLSFPVDQFRLGFSP